MQEKKGIVHASLTKFEDHIIKFEEKESEVNDCPLMQHLIGRLEAMDAEFKQHHQAVIDAIEEDEEKLLAE